MKKYSILFLIVWAISSVTAVCHGQTTVPESKQAFVSISYDWVEVDKADFDGVVAVEGGVLWPMQENLFVVTSITGINDSSTDTQEDNTGSYQLTLNSLELLTGVQYQHHLSDLLSAYIRGGLLAYRMEIELEEGFYGLKPSGRDSTSDTGWGLFVGAGVQWDLQNQWLLKSELLYRNRFDFLDSSSKPFDVMSVGIHIGLARHF